MLEHILRKWSRFLEREGRTVKFIMWIIFCVSLQSWEAIPPDTASFTQDISPLVLGAHRDNYEIIKILLDRGATLPMPHDVRYVIFECH